MCLGKLEFKHSELAFEQWDFIYGNKTYAHMCMYLGQYYIILHVGHIPNICNVLFIHEVFTAYPGGGVDGGLYIYAKKKLKVKLDWVLKIGSKNFSVTAEILKQFPSE